MSVDKQLATVTGCSQELVLSLPAARQRHTRVNTSFTSVDVNKSPSTRAWFIQCCVLLVFENGLLLIFILVAEKETIFIYYYHNSKN